MNVADHWKKFRGEHVRPEARPEELRILRAVFHAGAYALFQDMQELSNSTGLHGVTFQVELWREEFKTFSDEIRGRLA